MSYTPGFAPDAQSQWQSLEPRFQEIVLDELDRLALNPPTELEHVSDLSFAEGANRHYIFLQVFVNSERQIVTAVGVGYCVRPIEPEAAG